MEIILLIFGRILPPRVIINSNNPQPQNHPLKNHPSPKKQPLSTNSLELVQNDLYWNSIFKKIFISILLNFLFILINLYYLRENLVKFLYESKFCYVFVLYLS